MNGLPEPKDRSLHDKKEHINLEYPVDMYRLTPGKMSLGYMRWHWHEEVEISVVISGTADFKIADTSFRLETGQGIFVNQNVLHSIHPVGDEECILQVIVFNPAYLFGYGETYMCTKYLTPIVGSPTFKYYVLTNNDAFSQKVFKIREEMLAINNQRFFGYELSIKSCLCSFWLLLLEHYISEKPNIKDTSLSSDEARAKRALTYMQEHYAEAITLDSIANAIHVSKSECCRCFKRTLHMTPFEYLIKYRIFSATIMIVENNPRAETISDLALSVGFNSTSYFNKWFRHYLKCTPTQYKQKLTAFKKSDAKELLKTNLEILGIS